MKRWPALLIAALLLAAGSPAPGAQPWWSLQPLARPPVPVLADGWGRNPIDAFVRATLEKKGLRAAPEADRRTLIRRLSYDLHGLPPTPEQIDTFVQDPHPDAYERLIDRLLASPRYGERWGRHWLDVVHYGDTHGYDKDKRRDHAWPYRDYVIESFNADKPYARFVQEQLAGDVLWPGDPGALRATGFVVAGPWDYVGQVEVFEGTVEKLKTRLLDRDDMVANTAASFLSMTVHCARCHDHKFDPISQQDYYHLQAVFAGVERGNRPWIDAATRPMLARLAAEERRLAKRIVALEKQAAGSPEIRQTEEQIARLEQERASLPHVSSGAASPSNGYHSGIEAQPNVVKWVQVDLGKTMPIDLVRVIPARPTDFPDTPGFGFPPRFRIEVSTDPSFRTCVPLADHTRADFPNPGSSPFAVTGKGVRARYVRVTAERLWPRTGDYVFALAELQVESGGKNCARGAAVTSLDSIEAGRWSRRFLVDNFDSRQQVPGASNPKAVAAQRRMQALDSELSTARRRRQQAAAAQGNARQQEVLAEAKAELAALRRRRTAMERDNALYGVVSIPPRPVAVLRRGNVEQPQQPVGPGALSCVTGLEARFPQVDNSSEGKRRAALAAWITDPGNPLTWRSIANRVWHYHFGRGIVDTPNDFGRNGSRPTHPELLDWLACELRDSGGSLKHLHRLILQSATYRQACRHDVEMARIDAGNRYLWRMNRLRLDAEEVRDSVLAVSGRLVHRGGGPGYDLFRYKDDHSPVYDHEALEKIHDPTTYRRTVYRFVVRSVPNPFLDCLDCADPNVNTPVRNTTLTALQALVLLNDPFMVRQSEYFAARLQEARPRLEQQIDLACRLALGRPATPTERELLCGHAGKHGLANTCRLLFNSNEFLFLD